MRICPKCDTVNKDQNILCANCQEYIGAVPVEPDRDFAKGMVEKEVRRTKVRNIVSIAVFLAVYACFAVYFAFACYRMYGSLYYWLIQLPWYIPCLLLFIFPYNRVYQWFLKKRNKPPKPLDEYWTVFFRAVAVIYLFCLCNLLFDGLAMQPPV